MALVGRSAATKWSAPPLSLLALLEDQEFTSDDLEAKVQKRKISYTRSAVVGMEEGREGGREGGGRERWRDGGNLV